MKIADILLWVVVVLAAVYSIYEFMQFATARDPVTNTQNMWAGVNHLYLGIAAAVVAFGCAAWAYSRRPHEIEEIHITK